MILIRFRRWARSVSGQAAVILALTVVPLTLMFCLALDGSRRENVDQHVQKAADMAALAGARMFAMTAATEAEIIDATRVSFYENLATTHGDVSCNPPVITADSTAHTVKVVAECTMPTILGASWITPATMKIENDALAGANSSKLELALVVDISSSMSDAAPGGAPGETKIEALRAAAGSMVNKLVTNATGEDARISIIPFELTVNANVYGNPALGRPWNDDRHGDGVDTVCVTERLGDEAFTDAAPAPGAWVGQEHTVRNTCSRTHVQVQPLSNDGTSLSTYVANLPGSGSGTGGHTGLAWGWYTLSPKWVDIWPADSDPVAYGVADHPKVVVLMTDGVFNIAFSEPFQGSSLEQAAHICDGMKDEGIIVYTVGFDLAITVAEDFLKACATDEDHYFDANSTAELNDAFAAVAARFLGISLRE